MLSRPYEEVRHLRRIVAFDRRKSVLELGSGNGRWAMALGPLVGTYAGVDFSKVMIEFANRRVAQLGLNNVSFCEASVQDYVPTQTFDVIYLSSVTQYLHDSDLKALLVRLRRFLRPRGIMIDRSTTRPRGRCAIGSTDYFSIYRAPSDIVGLYSEAGWINYYHRPSYGVPILPAAMRRKMSGRKVARLVGMTAPFSFVLLRAWAAANGARFDRTGKVSEFSHDFFLFRYRKDGVER
jgi:ubiquinone/menaquinone biosynthesis C-methylase UbiE